MRKTDIDYSNTIIYKITCKDSLVTDVYVGHTINFVQRKCSHKQSCSNEKSLNYKCKLYEVIRNNGGWTNWHMEIINFYNCRDQREAREKEQEHFVSLNATLNSIEPFPKPKIKKEIIKKEIIKKEPIKKEPIKKEIVKKEFYCVKCNINFTSVKLLELHNATKKHKKLLDCINNTSIKYISESCNTKCSLNKSKKFVCEMCLFKCRKQSDWLRHINRPKHLKAQNNINNIPKNSVYSCINCRKEYKYYAGLWKHNKSCIIEHIAQKEDMHENIVIEEKNKKEQNDIKTLINLVLEAVKTSSELQKQITEMQK
jgi:hypothetical protein